MVRGAVVVLVVVVGVVVGGALATPTTHSPARSLVNTMRASVGGCACQESAWCAPVRGGAAGVTWLAPAADDKAMALVDWSVVSTVVVPDLSAEWVCLAHSKGVSARLLVVLSELEPSVVGERVKAVGGDGVVVDLTAAMQPANANAVAQWLAAVQALRDDGVHVGVVVPFSPSGGDGRIHMPVINALVKSADVVVVKGDGVRTNVFDRCVASSPSAVRSVVTGAQQYMDLGVPAFAISVVIPWHGVQYPCVGTAAEGVCEMDAQPSLTAPCSDEAATPVALSQVEELMEAADVHEDHVTRSHFLQYTDDHNRTFQVWFDTAEDLGHKYASLLSTGIGGVGVAADPTADHAGHERWAVLAAIHH